MESAILGLVLVGLGMLRASDDLMGSPESIALIVGLLAVTAVAAGMLHVAMGRAVPAAIRSPKSDI